ncbi:beta subunit of fatty acid synthetase [Neopestalotiopsis sp. 37M]|nr:beta subunit of fatty acid synthetase [Neopestalotiopsis sp. 37M]
MVHSAVQKRTSALLRAQADGRAQIHGVFGGQGNNKNYFEEIRTIFLSHETATRDLIEPLSHTLQVLSQDTRVSEQYPEGLDVMRWLEDPEATPSADYLITAPLSFPLIGLLQLAHLKAICIDLDVSPKDFPALFEALAGHSQGVVVAAAVSTASSWPEYFDAAIKAVTILFWIGARSQQAFSQDALPEEKTEQLEADGHGSPTPMLSISNINQQYLESSLNTLNQSIPDANHAHVSLVNSVSNFVVSGPVRTLAALIQSMRAGAAKEGQSQARVPFSQRKPSPNFRFLPITIPCHCQLLDAAVPSIDSDLSGINIKSTDLKIPVNKMLDNGSLVLTGGSTTNGNDNLVPVLTRLITSRTVNWADINLDGATHIIDFGPGATAGVGALTHRNVMGSGARTIIAGKTEKANSSELGSIHELLTQNEDEVVWTSKWSENQPVSLVDTSSGRMVASKLSRLLGLPPFFVAGMTPTTVHPEFVAAVMHAGYHVEFAAGGYHNADSLRKALYTLRDLMPAGRGITINVIYVSPKAIAWQIPFIRQLRAEGFPLTGMTVGGGVPSPDVATEYITTLGLEHISFKPGSTASIRQVVEIAKRNPTFPVLLQWTGGRGGGHHSAEDFHAPILETYAEIRACNNISLVAGSGFGCAEDVVPYLTGKWSLAHGRKALMPFDGAMFGSRVMACAEAKTSPGAKAAIVAAAGVDDKKWEGTYKGSTGGIISVVSEMGEPIHVVATRGALFWNEMDKTVFSLDKKKRVPVLNAKKDHIIAKLNADFQRPWFGRKADGTVCDIAQMTYSEVAQRLVNLMTVGGRRWIDETYMRFVTEILVRMEERFSTMDADASLIPTAELRVSPVATTNAIIRSLPAASSTLISAEDVDFFTQLCRRPGQKPVPFIPALDEHFETWFKKDSLWQSEDLESVIDQDAGRTFILHGPVATRQVRKVDEPVADVLNGINNGVIDHLYNASVDNAIPFEDSLQSDAAADVTMHQVPEGSMDTSLLTGSEVHDILCKQSTWASALFNSRFVVRGHDLIENPIRKLFSTLKVDSIAVKANSVSLFADDKIILLVSKVDKQLQVLPFTYVTSENKPITMALRFEYRPQTSYAPIWEVMEDRNERICTMYRQLWQRGATSVDKSRSSHDAAVFDDSFIVNESRVKAFNRAIGYSKMHREEKVPMDFAIVASWSPICKALLQDPIQGDVLNLVHLSNAYTANGNIEPLKMGEHIATRAFVSSITIEDSGKVVEVACELRRGSSGPLVLTVHSRFLFRGSYDDFSSTFARKVETPYELQMSSEADVGVLASKKWFILDDNSKLDYMNLTDLTLEFHLQTFTRWDTKSTYKSVDTSGKVFVRSEAGELTRVGFVKHHAGESRNNAVISYLSRRGRVVDAQQKHKLSGAAPEAPAHVSEIRIPASNEAYSRASGDFNPIHTSPLFAQLVDLPGTITHGMYCSAAVRQEVEKYTAGGNPRRIRKYDVSFVGMVLPNDTLEVSLRHSGMQNGLKSYDITVSKQHSGEKVLTGTTLIAQPSTTVVFTGQGSQEKGMGMDLYASSPVAKAIWDKADAYFIAQFGLSILDIVRNNPKEIKVHFGGVKGRMLRQNYLSMYYETPAATKHGKAERRPIFPSITEHSTSFMHSSPKGLLFATQFAQPALTIMEMAAFKDMQTSGVVDSDCQFAGHSLGEYSALASIVDFMPFENLLHVVFCRGMTMQGAVERDSKGRSAFSMVAVDPSRVRRELTDSALRELIVNIQSKTGLFVEIVNLNIRNGQYVCAGELRALDLLQKVCDDIKALPSFTQPTEQSLALIARRAPSYDAVVPQDVVLERGAATVPLAGVDVPFHSSFLRPRMEAFRRVLLDSLDAARLRPERLVGKYVPNVTGTPFAIDRPYFESVLEITKSERVRAVLENWDDWMARAQRQRAVVA